MHQNCVCQSGVKASVKPRLTSLTRLRTAGKSTRAVFPSASFLRLEPEFGFPSGFMVQSVFSLFRANTSLFLLRSLSARCSSFTSVPARRSDRVRARGSAWSSLLLFSPGPGPVPGPDRRPGPEKPCRKTRSVLKHRSKVNGCDVYSLKAQGKAEPVHLKPKRCSALRTNVPWLGPVLAS